MTRLFNRLEKKVEKIVSEKSARLDSDILETLVVTLGEDDTGRERFFEAIPGYYDSQTVVDVDQVKNNLSPDFFMDFRRTVMLFLDQTLSSDSVSELVKCRRILTCLNAAYRVLGSRADAVTSITHQIVRSWNWNAMMPLPPEVGHILGQWGNSTDSSIALIGSCTIARIIARVETHDKAWMTLAMSQLGVTEEVLRRYLGCGDSVLLANLIKTTLLFFDKRIQFREMLRSISWFNAKETLPELRRDFCTLWDKIVEKSEHSGEFISILREIRHVYDTLHPTTPTTSTTANNGSTLPGSTYTLCADPQYHNLRAHHPHVPLQAVPVAKSSSNQSSPGVRTFNPFPQRDETNINPTLESDTPLRLDLLSLPRELPIEHQAPALGHSSSATTSHILLATAQDVHLAYPKVIVNTVTGECDVQGPDAHNPDKSDPPARDISGSTSLPGETSSIVIIKVDCGLSWLFLASFFLVLYLVSPAATPSERRKFHCMERVWVTLLSLYDIFSL